MAVSGEISLQSGWANLPSMELSYALLELGGETPAARRLQFVSSSWALLLVLSMSKAERAAGILLSLKSSSVP